MVKNAEILAPAGDEESFFCAIYNGANAIYLGLKNFNARNKAQNFSLENLRRYVKIAHLYGVKIYLVVNTLVNNEELPFVISNVEGAINCKVDAFIVQDIGVAKLLLNTFKGIELHASTQMGVHSLQGAMVANELGFKRVVLSREVTLKDIKNIKNNTNLEIEYFVHGALCVCFSGNCYMSSLQNNESGNRGRCLQPCRLCYSSKSNEKLIKKGYLLSANDLCLIDKLNMLKESGVSSFKIEGRLRRPAYVACAVNAYAKANNAEFKASEKEAILRAENFKKLFNRGEYNTGYYLTGEPNKNIINYNFQNHRGVKIGVVKSIKPFKDIYEILVVTNGYEIKKNDGLKFIFNNNEQGIGVGSVNKTQNKNEFVIHSKTKPKISSEVFLTVDSALEETLISHKTKIKFNAEFYAYEGTNARLILKAKNCVVESVSNSLLAPAKSQALTENDVTTCLQKTLDTYFELNSLSCNMGKVFIAKSVLNELRREALNKLEKAIIENFENSNLKLIKKDLTFFNNLFKNSTNNCENVLANINALNPNITTENNSKTLNQNVFICVNEFTEQNKIRNVFFNGAKIVFSPTNFSLENIQNCIKNFQQNFGVGKVYLNLPIVLRDSDFSVVKNIITKFSTNSLGLVANNIGHLYFCNLGYEVIGGVYLNITNNASAQVLKDFNITTFVKSFESFANNVNGGLNYIGYPSAMTFCHCPYKTNFANDYCSNCKFNNNLVITNEDSKKSFNIRRTKINSCLFELVNNYKVNSNLEIKNCYLDLRN